MINMINIFLYFVVSLSEWKEPILTRDYLDMFPFDTNIENRYVYHIIPSSHIAITQRLETINAQKELFSLKIKEPWKYSHNKTGSEMLNSIVTPITDFLLRYIDEDTMINSINNSMNNFFKIEKAIHGEEEKMTEEEFAKLISLKLIESDNKLFGFNLSDRKEAYLFSNQFPERFSVYGLLEYYFKVINKIDGKHIFKYREPNNEQSMKEKKDGSILHPVKKAVGILLQGIHKKGQLVDPKQELIDLLSAQKYENEVLTYISEEFEEVTINKVDTSVDFLLQIGDATMNEKYLQYLKEERLDASSEQKPLLDNLLEALPVMGDIYRQQIEEEHNKQKNDITRYKHFQWPSVFEKDRMECFTPKDDNFEPSFKAPEKFNNHWLSKRFKDSKLLEWQIIRYPADNRLKK